MNGDWLVPHHLWLRSQALWACLVRKAPQNVAPASRRWRAKPRAANGDWLAPHHLAASLDIAGACLSPPWRPRCVTHSVRERTASARLAYGLCTM